MLNVFKNLAFAVSLSCVCGACIADTVSDTNDFSGALATARNKCVGIAADLQQIKKMATANTVVTGVGTVAGGVAVYAGIKKSTVDKKLSELERKLESLETMSDREFISFLKQMASYQEALKEYNSVCAQKKDLEKKSKGLGNLRTGMMAANTATAVAGTIMSSQNENQGRSMAERIIECQKSIDALKVHMGQSRVSGDNVAYQRLEKIVTGCSNMYSHDLDKIYANSNVSKITSAINIGTGASGTVASAVANTKSIRNDNSPRGQNKEKGWNIAANVLAGTSTVASGVSTIFNAKTIKAINDNIEYATQCEEALK